MPLPWCSPTPGGFTCSPGAAVLVTKISCMKALKGGCLVPDLLSGPLHSGPAALTSISMLVPRVWLRWCTQLLLLFLDIHPYFTLPQQLRWSFIDGLSKADLTALDSFIRLVRLAWAGLLQFEVWWSLWWWCQCISWSQQLFSGVTAPMCKILRCILYIEKIEWWGEVCSVMC